MIVYLLGAVVVAPSTVIVINYKRQCSWLSLYEPSTAFCYTLVALNHNLSPSLVGAEKI